MARTAILLLVLALGRTAASAGPHSLVPEYHKCHELSESGDPCRFHAHAEECAADGLCRWSALPRGDGERGGGTDGTDGCRAAAPIEGDTARFAATFVAKGFHPPNVQRWRADARRWSLEPLSGRCSRYVPQAAAVVGRGLEGNEGMLLHFARDLLAPLLARDAVFVGLQTEIRESDKAALGERSNLILAGQSFADFTDTAAVVAALDLVVTVDTSSAHLAGALGRPVWLLLPHVPDWRWLLDREDSPWYPTARLFRQDASRDWGAVIARVDRALAVEFPTTS